MITATGMAHVEFAKQFACHLGKVITVIDMGKETLVCRVEALPVGTVHAGVVEFLLCLAPDVLEVVCLSLGWLCHGECLERYGLDRSGIEIELAQGTALTDEITGVATLVKLERTCIYALHLQLRTLLNEVADPESHVAVVGAR